MLNRILVSLFVVMFLASCASAPRNQQVATQPKPFVAPWEYFHDLRPAVQYDQDKPDIQKTEYQTMGAETKEDHTQAIVIGTLVGVLTIGGLVAGILLLR